VASRTRTRGCVGRVRCPRTASTLPSTQPVCVPGYLFFILPTHHPHQLPQLVHAARVWCLWGIRCGHHSQSALRSALGRFVRDRSPLPSVAPWLLPHPTFGQAKNVLYVYTILSHGLIIRASADSWSLASLHAFFNLVLGTGLVCASMRKESRNTSILSISFRRVHSAWSATGTGSTIFTDRDHASSQRISASISR
jgi:hypothetical protein